MQIYFPDMLVIMDDSLVTLPATYDGLKDGGIVIINSKKTAEELLVPENAGIVASVDATGISEELFGKTFPILLCWVPLQNCGFGRQRCAF